MRGGGDDDVERDERGDDAVEPGMDGDAIRRETNRPAGWGYLARTREARTCISAHSFCASVRSMLEVWLSMHAAELIKDDAHVEVEEAERAQHDERQKKRNAAGLASWRGCSSTSTLSRASNMVPVPVERAGDKQGHQRSVEIIEVEVGVSPRRTATSSVGCAKLPALDRCRTLGSLQR